MREKPVPIGSIKQRSVKPSQLSSLSVNFIGGLGVLPSSLKGTFWGPTAPRCKNAEAEPGPPLKTKVIGRFMSLPSLI